MDCKESPVGVLLNGRRCDVRALMVMIQFAIPEIAGRVLGGKVGLIPSD